MGREPTQHRQDQGHHLLPFTSHEILVLTSQLSPAVPLGSVLGGKRESLVSLWALPHCDDSRSLSPLQVLLESPAGRPILILGSLRGPGSVSFYRLLPSSLEYSATHEEQTAV